MAGSVMIKGTKNGITLVLDENEEYDVLKEKVEKKFSESAKFLGNAKTALAFEGKKLSDEQKDEMLKIITDNTDLDIVCLLDNSEEANGKFAAAVNDKILEELTRYAKIHRGNLRSGQSIETDAGIVVLGDVNPGASLISKGSIIVLGTLRGTAWAGVGGNKDCFVICSDMMPVQLRIGDIIARS
ncbi:MAG: septum site-determining protein MinC, partial [Lachnospiraceae bacterium]|nr:septum site-determining protein MinC [Lachnospiraceae bacterium]